MAGAAQIQAEINRRVAEIPQFFGDKTKDKITASVWISKVDSAKQALNWNQEQTYSLQSMHSKAKQLHGCKEK